MQILTLLSLASTVLAAGTLPNHGPVIKSLHTFSPSGRPGQVNNYTIDFTVRDHNRYVDATTTCHASWDATTNNYPADGSRVSCKDSSFDFWFHRFTSYDDFRLDVTHSYIDNDVGDPPMNVLTTYNKRQIDAANLQCTHAASGFSACDLKAPVQMTFYAAVA